MNPDQQKAAVQNAGSNFNSFCQYAEEQLLDAYRQAGFDPDRYRQTRAECRVHTRLIRMILIGFQRMTPPSVGGANPPPLIDNETLVKFREIVDETVRRRMDEAKNRLGSEVAVQSSGHSADLVRAAVRESFSAWSAEFTKASQQTRKAAKTSTGVLQSWKTLIATAAILAAFVVPSVIWIDIRLSGIEQRLAARSDYWSKRLLANTEEEHKTTRSRFVTRPGTDILFRRLPAGSLQTWIPDPDHPGKGSWEFSTIKEAAQEKMGDVELRNR